MASGIQTTVVLLNGQGEYCWDCVNHPGEGVPLGCFTKEVTLEQRDLLKNRAIRMKADGRTEKWWS